MFKSLVSMLTIPIQIKKHTGTDGAGDKQYALPVDTMCYLEGTVKRILNNEGEEVISNRQFYLDGRDDVGPTDLIVFDKEYRVLALGPFYNTLGLQDIQVVYA